MGYEIQLNTFQGPLDLLYRLVKKNRIEISEISLASITEQYLDYVNKLKESRLDNLSEFMVIAAELIQIKAGAILPREDTEDEDDEEGIDLVQRLREYHYFKKVSEILKEYEKRSGNIFIREIDVTQFIEKEPQLELDIECSELLAAYKKVIKAYKTAEKKEENYNKVEWPQLEIEEVKIENKSEYIMEQLQRFSSGLSFSELVVDRENRMEIVVTFLSILELAKMKKIRLKQDRIFSNIHLV